MDLMSVLQFILGALLGYFVAGHYFVSGQMA